MSGHKAKAIPEEGNMAGSIFEDRTKAASPDDGSLVVSVELPCNANAAPFIAIKSQDGIVGSGAWALLSIGEASEHVAVMRRAISLALRVASERMAASA